MTIIQTKAFSLASFLSLERLWVGAALVFVFALVSFTWVYPADFWWPMKVGELVASGQGLPRTDPFSFTQQGQPYVFQNWLAGLVFYWLYSLGGLPLVVFFNALVFTLAYGLILWQCREESSRTRGAVLATLGGFALSIENWAVRPQTFSVLFFAIFFSLLWRYYRKREKKVLIPLPLLMALWVNLHGAFVLGLVLLLAFLGGIFLEKAVAKFTRGAAASPPWQPLAVAALLSVMATLLNPHAFGIFGYIWNIFTNQAIRAFMMEWAPTTPAFLSGRLLFLALTTTIVLFLLIRQGRTLDHPSLILYLVFAWLALGSVRNILWFGMIIAPILARQLDALANLLPKRESDGSAQTLREESEEPASKGAEKPDAVLPALLTTALLVSLVIMSIPWLRPLLPLPEGRKALAVSDTPFAVGEFLAGYEVKGEIFNDAQDGSYFIWRLYPEQEVFIDPRVELYPYELWTEYSNLIQGLGFAELLAKHGVNTLVLHQARQKELISAIEKSGDWQRLYSDRSHAVYAKQ